MLSKKKISARRKQVRENIAALRYGKVADFLNSGIPISILMLLIFAAASTLIIAFGSESNGIFRPWQDTSSIAAIILLVCMAGGYYVHQYEPKIIKHHTRALAIIIMFLILLAASRLGSFYPEWTYLATGSAVTSAIILSISYNQRFALGMSLFYSIIASFAVGAIPKVEILLTMTAGVVMCTYTLKEIRTRMKLLEVGVLAALAVFAVSLAVGFIIRSNEVHILGVEVARSKLSVFINSGTAAGITFVVGLLIQALLPLIERAFKIATSMTLLDFSDANQPLLKRLAMEAPGTYSHCLLIGSVAEAAAESIGVNGLLCRVGAYYHDIGKINKPRYFVENQMGSTSSHDQLSPAMSQLVIVGHVKDGIEMAKEYGLPAILRQFIETHHGTTLIEYFYEQAKKRSAEKQAPPPSETEFRYPGPKPQTKESAILMLADVVEGAVRSLAGEITPNRIESVVHNMAMKRLQDGQFDECELTLKELSQIEVSVAKSLAGHYHGRIAYPKAPDAIPAREEKQDEN